MREFLFVSRIPSEDLTGTDMHARRTADPFNPFRVSALAAKPTTPALITLINNLCTSGLLPIRKTVAMETSVVSSLIAFATIVAH